MKHLFRLITALTLLLPFTVLTSCENLDHHEDLYGIEFMHNGIHYRITDNSANSCIVISLYDYSEGNYNHYEGHIYVPATVEYRGRNFSVVGIDDMAFYQCNDLQSISLPTTLRYIGESAFSYCSALTSIDIPNNVNSIGKYAFYSCSSLLRASLPNNISNIEYGMFGDCIKLSHIEIPNSVTEIGGYAFDNCQSLYQINIPDRTKKIGHYAFSKCTKLNSIFIPNSVTSIGDGAFNGCHTLIKVDISESISTIGDYTFYDCSSLKEVSIPAGVNKIGSWAFSGCDNLKTIYAYSQNPPQLGSASFDSDYYGDLNRVLYVPYLCKNAYRNTYWGTIFDNIQEML